MENKLLGQRIKQVRKDKKLTAKELAEIIHIDATFLRQIEGGSKLPSLPVFIDICNCLNISPDYLLQGNLKNNELSNISELTAFWNKALPNQIEMVTAIIKTALEVLQNN